MRHDRVPLTATERAEFRSLTRRIGTPPSPSALSLDVPLSRGARYRIAAYAHLRRVALLAPIGAVVLILALMTWWPLGLVGAAMVAVGQWACYEIIRMRWVRGRLRSQSDS